MPKAITIVGGGLAGLTLGIGLRQRGIPVVIWEAGTYPRHRVCGEFISGNGTAVLRRSGLLKNLEEAGAIQVHSVAFISGSNRSPVRALPDPAVGLSRHAMDSALANEFQRIGGEIHPGIRRPENDFGEGIVRASGRRAQPTENGWRWFGLKAHATNVSLSAGLEMHVSADSYVGVSRIDRGRVNVCGLFRARPGQTHESGFDLLRGQKNSSLRERLTSARFDTDSFCSVAGLSLRPQLAADKRECCIGDAVTMIPPVTGNGMSMAFESAEIAIDPLARYSAGEIAWPEARDAIARACDTAFAQRLTWAHRLQTLMFSPLMQSPLCHLLLRSDALWAFLFQRTR